MGSFLWIIVFITCTSPQDDPFSCAKSFFVQQDFYGCSTLLPTHCLREGALYIMYLDIIVFRLGSCSFQLLYVYGTHCIIFWLCYANMSCTIQHILHCLVLYLWALLCLPYLSEVHYHNMKGDLH